ncbi:hypothetical protein NAD41_000894 [Salmonella enterica]|nr:hypothetical protein [Salmonella enterica]EKK6596278.1 hypothetical protein [Salmonella enterica]
MNKSIVIAVAAVLGLTACSANAISEKYRKQLEHEHKTQVQDARPVDGGNATYVYADNMIEVQADHNCRVKKVNGFAPKSVKQVKKDMWQVQTAMGATLSVLKIADSQCDITWTNKSGQSGVLAIK